MIEKIVAPIKTIALGLVKNKLFGIKRIFTEPYRKVNSYIHKIKDVLLKDPSSRKDYVEIGKLLVSKKMLYLSIAGFFVLAYLFMAYAYPWVDGRFWTTDLMINSEKYQTFSGKVRVHDLFDKIVFKGEMKDGVITGYGEQYESNGQLVYKGYFENSEYSGKGEFYTDGILEYKGDFSQSLYNGEGELYASDGSVIYKGSFVNGQRSGDGIEYTDKGLTKTYQGEFLNDVREGNGKEYESDGKTILYDGQFSSGVYNGKGRLYSLGSILYSGNFADGVYDGTGILYDTKNGNMIYNGNFKSGLYEGEGKLYNRETGLKIYEGNFQSGKREGEGKVYDSLGAVSFSGNFMKDGIDYIGYIGKDIDSIVGDFGQESYRTQKDSKVILTYINLDVSMIFDPDEKGEKYTLTNVMMGTKNAIFGITANMKSNELNEIFGSVYASSPFTFSKIQQDIFNQLGISLKGSTSAPSDKYLMDSYYIRIYYTSDRERIECVELGTI